MIESDLGISTPHITGWRKQAVRFASKSCKHSGIGSYRLPNTMGRALRCHLLGRQSAWSCQTCLQFRLWPLPLHCAQAGLRLLLRKGCLQGWHLGSWILGGAFITVRTDKNSWLCLNSLDKQHSSCCTFAFLLGVWEFWYAPSRGCQGDQYPVKVLGGWDVAGWQRFTRVTITHCCGIKRIPMTAGGRPLDACALLPLDFTPCAFSMTSFASAPSAVVSHSKWQPMLSPLSESEPRVFLVTAWHCRDQGYPHQGMASPKRKNQTSGHPNPCL